MRFHVESDALSSAGRAAHDIGLATTVGGNLFARLGMHPAVAKIADERERGNLGSALALVAINSSLSQANFRRPPVRRLLRRRY